jgi:hypothetical protein
VAFAVEAQARQLGVHRRGVGRGVLGGEAHAAVGGRERFEVRLGADLVDLEVVDHRLHDERQCVLELRLGLGQLGRDALAGQVPLLGIDQEGHASAGQAAEHQEAVVAVPDRRPHALDQAFGEGVGGLGHDRRERTAEVGLGQLAQAFEVAGGQGCSDLRVDRQGLLARVPGRLGAQQVLLGDQLEDRPDVLGHAAVDQDHAAAEALARLRADVVEPQQRVPREQTPMARAELRVARLGHGAFDAFEARPQAAGVLPAAARTAEPLAEDRATGDLAQLGRRQRAGDALGLAARAHQHGDQRAQKVGRDGQARALGDAAHPTRKARAAPAEELAEDFGQRSLALTLEGRRHPPRGDHRGLEQPQVVGGEVEQVRDGFWPHALLQVTADELQTRRVRQLQARFDRRLRRRVAPAHAEVHRHVEHARPLGAVHRQEEDVAPTGVGQVQAHRGALDQRLLTGRPLGRQAQGSRRRHAVVEQPAVALRRAHRSAHLLGQRVEGQPAVGFGQGARERGARALLALGREAAVHGLLEASLAQVLDGVDRQAPAAHHRRLSRHVEAVQRVELEQRPHPAVEVVGRAPGAVQGRRGLGQVVVVGRAEQVLERRVAEPRIVALQPRHEGGGQVRTAQGRGGHRAAGRAVVGGGLGHGWPRRSPGGATGRGRGRVHASRRGPPRRDPWRRTASAPSARSATRLLWSGSGAGR